MALRFNEKLIQFKTESTYGTDPSPAATDAILTRNFRITPVAGNRRPRTFDRPQLGGRPRSVTGVHRQVSFDVELAGSGAAGTAPAWAELIQACGFDETVVPSTSVSYAPNSADGDSGTLYFNLDGVLMEMNGARGAVGFSFVAGEVAMANFTFHGLLVAATDAAAATPDYSDFVDALEVNNANTTTLSVHGYSGITQRLVIGQGQQLNYRNWPGQEAVRIGDREYTAQCAFLMPTVSAFDIEAKITSEALAALSLVHGTSAGNIATVSADHVQILDYSVDGDQGDALVNLDLLLTSDAGDDDFGLALT